MSFWFLFLTQTKSEKELYFQFCMIQKVHLVNAHANELDHHRNASAILCNNTVNICARCTLHESSQSQLELMKKWMNWNFGVQFEMMEMGKTNKSTGRKQRLGFWRGGRRAFKNHLACCIMYPMFRAHMPSEGEQKFQLSHILYSRLFLSK